MKPVLVLIKNERGEWVRGGEVRIHPTTFEYMKRQLGGKRGMLVFIEDDRVIPPLSTGEDSAA